jgi:hypothetical protein
MQYLYTLQLIDKITQPLQRVGAEGTRAYRQLANGQREWMQRQREANAQMSGFTSQVARFITVAGTIALGADSLKKWNTQVQAEAQVMQGIISTNGAAGRSFGELTKAASELQSKTIFGDEAILQNVTAQMLTFTNITGTNFDALQKTVLDVTTRLNGANASGESLKGTSIMLGKALNDPVANLGALSRAGIQFSDSQTEMIKSMWNGGQQAQAQALIIEELNRQYGGSAEAAAKAGLGPWQQVMNTIGDIQETLGPPIMNFVNLLKSMVDFAIENGEAIKTVTTIVGSAVAAYYAWTTISRIWLIGEKIALGVKFLSIAVTQGWTAAQTALNVAMTANPIGLVVAAIVALIAIVVWAWNKFEGFRKVMYGVWESMAEVGKLIGNFLLDIITAPIKALGLLGKAFMQFVKGDWKGAMNTAKDAALTFTGVNTIKNAIEGGKKVGAAYAAGAQKGAESFKKSKSQTSAENGLALGAGGSAGVPGIDPLATDGGTKGGVAGITEGGSKQTNITISGIKLIENLTLRSENVREGAGQIRDILQEELLRVLNAANLVAHGS